MIRNAQTGGRTAWLVLVAACALAAVPATVHAQGADEAVMIAAGSWAGSQLPGSGLRLDPHRTGRSTDPSVAERVARALGADLGTLDQARTCRDPMAPSSCVLAVDRLLAISAPRVRDDAAEVRVYAWYRQDSSREPVGRTSWDLTLRRTADGWRVEGSRERD